MNRIKILHIQLLPLLSGVQNMMISLLTALNPEKYEIFIISKPDGPLVEKIKNLKFHYIPIKSLRRNISFWDLIAFIEIYRICKIYRFDIVHTHSSKTGFIGRISARLAGIPRIVHTVHGFPFHQFQPNWIQYFYQIMEHVAAKFCDKIVFVNNFERELAIEKKIAPTWKVTTIYNGINIPKITKKNNDQNLKDNFIIGSVSRFSKQKNVLIGIKIAFKVCRKNKNIKFIFIGDGELFAICNRMVNYSGLNQQIILKGWQDNVIEWLQLFDVFLLFSKWEGLPISILEAMSIGLPIIASDIKGNRELVSKENGILIPINDEDRLEKVLLSLPYRKKELESLGKNSLKIVKRDFCLKKFVASYEKIYDS